MLELDTLTDELFGDQSSLDEPQACLKMLRPILGTLKVLHIALFNAEGGRCAVWPTNEIAELFSSSRIVPKTAATTDEGACVTFSSDGYPLLTVSAGGDDLPRGYLVIDFESTTTEEQIRQQIWPHLAWLRIVASGILAAGDRAAAATEAEVRLHQMEQRHKAFQAQHQRIVEMNLKERDDRIREQRDYARLLEEEVELRTRELVASEAETRAILDTAPDGIITFDRDGVIRSCNRAANLMFGFAQDDFVGMHASVLLGDSVQWILADGGFDFSTSDQVRSVDHEFLAHRLNGNTFPMHFAVSSVKIESGRLFTVIMRDVTEQKETEQLILSQKDRLEASNRAKSEFLANMSHEIRTPMTAILGFAEVLREKNSSPEQIEAINTILRNGNYLLEIINDILDLSKIESGKIEVEHIDVEPLQIVNDVVALMTARAAPKRLSLDVDCRGPIPKTIQSDPTRLRQILVNLVGNSIKFTEQGGVTIAVQLIEQETSNPKLLFEVNDTGIGIASETIQKLFKPFQQADSSMTRRFGGTGLGLAICQRLSEMLGGEIGVESELGRGSTFRVTIATGDLHGVPMLTDLRCEQTIVNPVEDAPTTLEIEDSPQATCRILLAEDGPDNQRLIKFILKKSGMDVTVVENGELALNAALKAREEGTPFDVILMDMQMPVMDGYTATTKLREADYRLPVIALTAHAMKTDRQKCLDAGCDEYTTKPIKREELIGLIFQMSGKEPADQSAE